MEQTCILVLGMHRSGTSAITGVLSMLGAYLGTDLMEENFANVKGYFENNNLYKINDELLEQANSSWDDEFFEEDKISNIEGYEKLKNEIKNEFQNSSLFAIKDPRIAFLFPLYKSVLKELNINIKIIVPFRSPIEVAESLNIRNNFSHEKGILLWAHHVLLAEKYSREFDRVFIKFDELLLNTKSIVTLISDKLHINFGSKYATSKEKINEFLESDLKHCNRSIDNISEATPNIIRKILQLLKNINDEPNIEKFDGLRKELFSYRSLFYNEDIIGALDNAANRKQNLTDVNKELQQAAEELEKILQHKTEELEKSKQKHNMIEKGLRQKEEELNNSRQLLSAADKRLQKIAKEHEICIEKHGEKDRALTRISIEHEECKQVVSNIEKILSSKIQEINSLKGELVSIYTGRSWKITRPLRRLKKILK